MKRHRALLAATMALFLVTGSFDACAAATYAYIEFVEGTVNVFNGEGQSRPAIVKERILEGETIVTGKDGELHARTDDHGLIAMRTNTKFTIEAYRARGDDGDTSITSLAYGTLRSITGWIGKFQSEKYRLKTPTATIGIRGTDHEPLFVPAGDKGSSAAGTYDKVNAGGTYIENEAGRVHVDAGQAGFAPLDPKAPPKILPRIPDAYQPSRNEGRIRERKEELAREVESARAQRRKEGALKEESHKRGEAARKKPPSTTK